MSIFTYQQGVLCMIWPGLSLRHYHTSYQALKYDIGHVRWIYSVTNLVTVSLSNSVHNYKIIWQINLTLRTNKFSRDLGLGGVSSKSPGLVALWLCTSSRIYSALCMVISVWFIKRTIRIYTNLAMHFQLTHTYPWSTQAARNDLSYQKHQISGCINGK